MRNNVVVGLLIVLLALLVPHVLAAGPGSSECDYKKCLDTHGPEYCACCVISNSGSLQSCGSLASCTKLIGVYINSSNVSVDGRTESGYTSIAPSGATCQCCNVGVLIGSNLGGVDNVSISHVNVTNWANGILFWNVKVRGNVSESNIIGNENGVYLFNSYPVNLYSNNISNNTFGIVTDSKPLSKGFIYNNIFDNARNLCEAHVGSDYASIWNVSEQPGSNIISGPYIGGNYWAIHGVPPPCPHTDYPQNCSQSCTCQPSGFCSPDPPCDILSNNRDFLPLCKYVVPVLSIQAEPPTLDLDLRPVKNFFNDNITLTIESSTDWHVTATSDPSDGRMVTSSGLLKLISPLQVGNDGTCLIYNPCCPLTNIDANPTVARGNGGIGEQHAYIDLNQTVQWTEQPDTYYINLTFTVIPSIG